MSESGDRKGVLSFSLWRARTLDRLELRCGTTENDVLGVGDKVEHRVQPVEHQIVRVWRGRSWGTRGVEAPA